MSLVNVKFNVNNKWIHATWVYNTENWHIIIDEWSTLTTWEQTMKSAYNAHKKLVADWTIVWNTFTRDCEFNSPTAAAVLLLWRNASWPQWFSIEWTWYPLMRVSRLYNIKQSIKWEIKKDNYPKEFSEDLIKWFLSHLWENTDNPTKENLLNVVRRINNEYDVSKEIKEISNDWLDKAIRITADANWWWRWWRTPGSSNKTKSTEKTNVNNLFTWIDFTWSNILYYWVPWCWKSYSVKKEIEKEWYIYRRILFHPEYSYADFVWQILPKKKWDDIVYEFIAWPFTEILSEALNNPQNKYCLVIEEINRWNASAIFWDIFQLLDREREWINKWESEYWIQNERISSYLSEGWIGVKEIKIPRNLSLIATMNSSDQNVFVLDTAFKRRWNFKKVSNEFSPNHPFKNNIIDRAGITWENFVITINDEISKLSKYWINWDDKQIWLFFVSKEDLEDWEKFAEKILLYLREDVVKFNKSLLFKEEYTSIDKLIKWFIESWLGVFKEWIFTSWEENSN